MEQALVRLRAAPRGQRVAAVVLCAALVALAVLALAPVVHGEGYYRFPDRRSLLGIPNAPDVLTNLPFALVGWLGLLRSARLEPRLRACARLVFLSVGAATLGSTWYHLAPSPDRLLLDRLPITLAFAALFAWVLGDRLGARWATRTLAPLLALAMAALATWYGGGDGGGDLRPYVLVQAVPLACMPFLLALFPGRLDERRFVCALALYALGKVCELFDAEILSMGGIVGGHALKHLLSAAACACLVPRALDRS